MFGDSPAQSSDGLNFAGARYEFTPQLNTTYYFGQLEDIYKQHYAAAAYTMDLGNGYSLKSDLRYYNTQDEGAKLSGSLDNSSLGLMTALSKGGHTFTAAYQRMYGDDAFPLLNGYAPSHSWSTGQPSLSTRPRSAHGKPVTTITSRQWVCQG